MTGPYGESEGFTPYEPGTQPDADEASPADAPPAEPAPYVPYGAVTAAPTPVASPPPPPVGRKRPAALVIGVVVALLGLGAGAAVAIAGISGSVGSTDDGLDTNDLTAGECLVGAGLDPGTDDPVSDLEDVDCATAHDAEVLQINVLDSAEADAYDFDDAGQIDQTCRRFLDPDQKKLLESDDYFLIALTESETPSTGDHVACLVVRSDGGPLHSRLG